MPDSQINSAYQQLIDWALAEHNAESGQMFGKPCLKINGKAAIARYQDCIVFKLPAEPLQLALNYDGSELWNPSGKGRAMKEWVQIPLANQENYRNLAIAAVNYVG